jgi:SAM-dependent methyltransferase
MFLHRSSPSKVTLSEQIRRIYERRPYPFGNAKALTHRTWTLGLEWMLAIGRSDRRRTPRRVLVAGCGDGTEAFNLRRFLPASEIVAVDFSKRSIGIARRLQKRRSRLRSIRFVLGDLSDRKLPKQIGDGFDLILCHGVFSYIPKAAQVLRTFARLLAPDGVLYLGVNGASHLSLRLRRALPELGFDLRVFKESAGVRRTLRLCDCVLSGDRMPRVSHYGAEYLGGDIFGAMNRSLPLREWAAQARRAGLHLRGSQASIRTVRRITESDLDPLLLPRSRAEVAALIDLLSPAQFHRLLFSRTAEANPPWTSRRELGQWRLVTTRLFRMKLPRPPPLVRDRARPLRLTSRLLRLAVTWQMPEWELDLLCRSDGRRSIADVLRPIPLAVPFRDLQRQLYLLYQLGAINLLSPAPDGRVSRAIAGSASDDKRSVTDARRVGRHPESENRAKKLPGQSSRGRAGGRPPPML